MADGDLPHIVFVCTGNAARSVMAGAVLAGLAPDVRVTTAGTHVVEGQPMSWRTRDAIVSVGVEAPRHRSLQLRATDVDGADLVIGLAIEHVAYVRRTHPSAAGRTATLRRFVRDLPDGPAPLASRVASLGLAGIELEPWEDVADPAGGEIDIYLACAKEVEELVAVLAPRLLGGLPAEG